MKTTFAKHDLARALELTKPAIPSKPAQPILAGVLITVGDDAATFDAFDRTSQVHTTIPCDTREPGQVLLPHRTLHDVVAKLPDKPITITHMGSAAQFTCGPRTFELPPMTIDDYPPLPDMPPAVGAIDWSDLAAAIREVGAAAGRDDTLPMLTGIKVDARDGALTLAATDRFRLAHTTLPWDGDDLDMLIPARDILTLARTTWHGDVTIHHDQRRLGFTLGDTRTILRLIDADFPKWRPLIPKDSDTTIRIDRKTMADAVKFTSVLAGDTGQVVLSITGGQVTIASKTAQDGAGEEVIACDTVGKELNIAFTSRYLLDALAGDGTALMTFTRPGRPAMVWPDLPCGEGKVPDADRGHLLMPVRLPG